MTSTLDMPASGAGFESFWVPSATVSAGPSVARLTPVPDVTRVSFRDNLNQIDAFDFTVGNRGWAPNALSTATDLPNGTLLPGAYVQLSLGYRHVLPERLMLTGRVVAVAPTFGPDGAATLTVRALSDLEALRAKENTVRWPKAKSASGITDSEIASEIAASHRITLLVPSGLKEARYSSVTQTSETDIAFLLRRARHNGYIVAYRELTGGRRVLYFGPSNLLGAAERVALGERRQLYRLGYGSGLTDFRPTLNVSTTLWRSVAMSFWDRRTKKKIPVVEEIEPLWRSEHGLNGDLWPIAELALTAEQKLPNIPVHTAAEARLVCRNQLRENYLGLVTAEGTCVGLPELRAASTVEVAGVGQPFSGTWRLTSTTHTVDESGYRTTFSARREQWTT